MALAAPQSQKYLKAPACRCARAFFSVNVDHNGVEQAFMLAVLRNKMPGFSPCRILSGLTVRELR